MDDINIPFGAMVEMGPIGEPEQDEPEVVNTFKHTPVSFSREAKWILGSLYVLRYGAIYFNCFSLITYSHVMILECNESSDWRNGDPLGANTTSVLKDGPCSTSNVCFLIKEIQPLALKDTISLLLLGFIQTSFTALAWRTLRLQQNWNVYEFIPNVFVLSEDELDRRVTELKVDRFYDILQGTLFWIISAILSAILLTEYIAHGFMVTVMYRPIFMDKLGPNCAFNRPWMEYYWFSSWFLIVTSFCILLVYVPTKLYRETGNVTMLFKEMFHIATTPAQRALNDGMHQIQAWREEANEQVHQINLMLGQLEQRVVAIGEHLHVAGAAAAAAAAPVVPIAHAALEAAAAGGQAVNYLGGLFLRHRQKLKTVGIMAVTTIVTSILLPFVL